MLENTLQTQRGRVVICERYRATDWKRYTDIKIEGKEWNSNIKRETERDAEFSIWCGCFSKDFSSPAPMCDVIWQSKAALSHSLSFHPLRSQDLHCAPLSTLVGDHIWLEPAPGTPTMVCKIQLHQPLTAFEGAWLLTTRDSWIAPQKWEGCEWEGEKGSGVLTCPTVKPCSISPAALLAWLDHQATWFLSSSYSFPLPKLLSRQRGLTWG